MSMATLAHHDAAPLERQIVTSHQLAPRSFLWNSIRVRLTAAFALAAAVLLLLTGGGLLWYARHNAELEADNLLLAAAQKVQREYKMPESDNDLNEMLNDERDLTHRTFVLLIVDVQGNVLQKSQKHIPFLSRSHASDWRTLTQAMGSNRITVGMLWEPTEHNFKTMAMLLTSLGIFVLLAVTLGAWLLVGQALSPLPRLALQAHAATTESLRVSLAPPSQDTEIVALVDTLNGLLRRLSEAAAARGRFYAAASHELRTPLQALSGHLELALTRPREAQEYRDVVQEAHTQALRLISLTQDLLLLNQLDSAPMPALEAVEVGEMCERALSHLSALIGERHLVLQADWSETLTIEAPPHQLEMLTRNLIENAVKYAEAGGTVRVDLLPATHTLEIFNACAPIPQWDEKKLFEPFYRLDESRNSKTGGNGLGLAICKAIADANGWHITLSQVAGGVLARVHFPELIPV